MSDPIVEMLRPCMRGSRDVREKVANDLAKQIRQQVGRDIKEKAYKMEVCKSLINWILREICKLDEDKP